MSVISEAHTTACSCKYLFFFMASCAVHMLLPADVKYFMLTQVSHSAWQDGISESGGPIGPFIWNQLFGQGISLYQRCFYFHKELHPRQTLRQTADWSRNSACVPWYKSSARDRHVHLPCNVSTPQSNANASGWWIRFIHSIKMSHLVETRSCRQMVLQKPDVKRFPQLKSPLILWHKTNKQTNTLFLIHTA